METFSTLLTLYAGNSPVTNKFPALWPVTRSFDVFFDRGLNKRLSKQPWGWWFETPSCPLWRHRNEMGRQEPIYPQLLIGMTGFGNLICQTDRLSYYSTHEKGIGVTLFAAMNINATLIARSMGPTWGPSGADRTQMDPMLATWTLLSGYLYHHHSQHMVLLYLRQRKHTFIFRYTMALI